MPELPFIPETITVHLGPPDSNAENVTIPFLDYIANVASSEVYPTWPENAIRANIYAQVSFALNRVYTEYYRTRGYNFDITNYTGTDQSFVNGRVVFENVRSTPPRPRLREPASAVSRCGRSPPPSSSRAGNNEPRHSYRCLRCP